MKLVINLGTLYEPEFHNDYFLTEKNWEEETANLETARSRLEKDFKIYYIYESNNEVIAYVY